MPSWFQPMFVPLLFILLGLYLLVERRGDWPSIDRSLKGRLHEIGVEQTYPQDRRRPHPKARLYRLTDELIEFVGGGEAQS